MKYFINEHDGSKTYTHAEFATIEEAQEQMAVMLEDDPNMELYVSTRPTKAWREEHLKVVAEPIVQEFAEDEVADESDEALWGPEDETSTEEDETPEDDEEDEDETPEDAE